MGTIYGEADLLHAIRAEAIVNDANNAAKVLLPRFYDEIELGHIIYRAIEAIEDGAQIAEHTSKPITTNYYPGRLL